MDRILYETPIYEIGRKYKTQWKLQVYERDDELLNIGGERGLARYTRYMYNAGWGGIIMWTREINHPKYDSNDGTWAGLPHGLRKIYEKHIVEIKEALIGYPSCDDYIQLLDENGKPSENHAIVGRPTGYDISTEGIHRLFSVEDLVGQNYLVIRLPEFDTERIRAWQEVSTK